MLQVNIYTKNFKIKALNSLFDRLDTGLKKFMLFGLLKSSKYFFTILFLASLPDSYGALAQWWTCITLEEERAVHRTIWTKTFPLGSPTEMPSWKRLEKFTLS